MMFDLNWKAILEGIIIGVGVILICGGIPSLFVLILWLRDKTKQNSKDINWMFAKLREMNPKYKREGTKRNK